MFTAEQKLLLLNWKYTAIKRNKKTRIMEISSREKFLFITLTTLSLFSFFLVISMADLRNIQTIFCWRYIASTLSSLFCLFLTISHWFDLGFSLFSPSELLLSHSLISILFFSSHLLEFIFELIFPSSQETVKREKKTKEHPGSQWILRIMVWEFKQKLRIIPFFFSSSVKRPCLKFESVHWPARRLNFSKSNYRLFF